RVKGGVSRRSGPLTRFAVCLIQGRKGEARWPGAVQRCKRRGCPIIECAVWPSMVVMVTPAFQFFACLIQRCEPFHVEAFIPQPAVEALDEAVFHRSPRSDEAELHARLDRPELHRTPSELTAIVESQAAGRRTPFPNRSCKC